jgi:hypothetical protein
VDAAGSGTWPPAAAGRGDDCRQQRLGAGHTQPFLRASRRHSCRPSSPRATVAPPGLSRRRATRSTSGAPLLGRPPPGALAWPAAAGHRHPRGGRPGGGQALRGGGETTGRSPCCAVPELESEDGVDLIRGMRWPPREDGGGGRRSRGGRAGVGGGGWWRCWSGRASGGAVMGIDPKLGGRRARRFARKQAARLVIS